ncbi:hypothetical protein NL676_008920 [Syzygium grande]|nr:hypothetical protein NL676_008920 [Syzygium grande]
MIRSSQKSVSDSENEIRVATNALVDELMATWSFEAAQMLRSRMLSMPNVVWNNHGMQMRTGWLWRTHLCVACSPSVAI